MHNVCTKLYTHHKSRRKFWMDLEQQAAATIETTNTLTYRYLCIALFDV